MYSLIIGISYRANTAKILKWKSYHGSRGFWIFILTLIFAVTNYTDGDYWNYLAIVKNQSFYGPSHLEDVYVRIIEFVDREFALFRAIVWGCALVCYCLLAKTLQNKVFHAVFVLVACYFIQFFYGRVSLAIAMAFLGYSLFYANLKKNIFLRILGIAIFICSYFFHRSIVIVMAMCIIMPFIPFNRKSITLALLCVPIIFLAFKSFFAYMLTDGDMLAEDTTAYMQRYSEADRGTSNWKGMIRNFIEYSSFYIPVIIMAYQIYYKKQQNKLPKLVKNIFKIGVGLVVSGTLFLFMDMKNTVFAYRIIYMAIPAICLSLINCYKFEVISRKSYRFCIWCGMASTFFVLLYCIYIV